MSRTACKSIEPERIALTIRAHVGLENMLREWAAKNRCPLPVARDLASARMLRDCGLITAWDQLPTDRRFRQLFSAWLDSQREGE